MPSISILCFFNKKVLDTFSSLFHKNIYIGGTMLEAPQRAAGKDLQCMFLWRNKKNIYLIPLLS